MNDTYIELKNIYKGYRAKPKNVLILKNINLKVSKGDFLVLFGPSGSGKSTLVNTIMGLEKPNKGNVLYKGKDITKLTEDELAEFRKLKVGIVYQQPYWIKSLNVLENVYMPLVLRGADKEKSEAKALDILKSLDLKEWAGYHPHELSSGQQQKVSLARALISDPEIIIADEPTGNLDYKSGKHVTSYLRDLTDSGKTVIMVTHNLDNLDYAKRVLHIFDGQIAEDFTLTESNLMKVKATLIDENIPQTIETDNKLTGELDELITKNNSTNGTNRQGIISRIISSIGPTFKSILLATFLIIHRIIDYILSIRLLPSFLKNLRNPLSRYFRSTVDKFDNSNLSISYYDIFNLSHRSLFAKKFRTLITIFGIALGIGFTAFLISLGYGLELLVISKSAELEQLKQIDVYPPLGETVPITDATIANVKTISNVAKVLPIINVAGKVDYQNSDIDVVVYGVQGDYLKLSDSTLLSGEYFTNNTNTTIVPASFAIPEESRIIDLKTNKAVVNVSFLELLSLDSSIALSTKFKLGFVPVNNLTDINTNEQVILRDYEISGIISNNDSPIIYTQIEDVKRSGIDQYSQLRVVSNSKESIYDIRQQLNVLGFRTTSVQDTVTQIEGFFTNARIVFAVVGLVALFVGSLGMFNTLTVSLLERTREVGLLKTMGMKSNEIKDVFISESMIMGLYGGFLGISLSLFLGFVISSIISSISVVRGFDALNITYLPLSTALLIILVSALTGIATGFYPSKRATRISALDALRYE